MKLDLGEPVCLLGYDCVSCNTAGNFYSAMTDYLDESLFDALWDQLTGRLWQGRLGALELLPEEEPNNEETL